MNITEHLYDGIPLTIYHNDDNKVKPLIYFFHGFTGNKDANIMGRGEVLANMGFYVVAIDAYLHGKRMSALEKTRSNISKYEDIIEIVMHTAKDAKRLFHKYFKHEPNVIEDRYYLYGVSMGSLTAFYLSTMDHHVKAMVGLVCTPSFVDYYKDKASMYGFNQGFYYERKLSFYAQHDPLIHSDRLNDTKIFMGVGTKDEVVKPIYAERLKAQMPEVILNHYDTGHISTPEMLKDSYQFLQEVIK
ncbi:MAG: hypothetical protein CVV63_04755 [Tenericutes bacterium HGW-Tenericutes-8]|nr:MAG: hypothetical protein CVV63_04755 [Tenericutes bacterium HGW-Tenericutes-8]